MLSIGIRYLTGSAVATDPSERDRVEWPPHPARVYMAMVAAHGETGEDPAEAAALRWLEEQQSPAGIYARPLTAPEGAFVTRFVPVNDRAGPAKGTLQSVPALTRARAARTFPSVHLQDDRVFLTWDAACPAEHRAGLEAVLSKVSRIGHSSSLVQMWIADEAPEPTWRQAGDDASHRMRGIGPGLLDSLRSAYHADPPQRPQVSTWARYAPAVKPRAEVPRTIWEPGLSVLTLRPLERRVRQLDLVSTLALTGRLHQAVLAQIKENIPEFVSGHREDGTSTDQPHVAFLPLAFVGSPHADGLIRGVGIALPRSLSREDRRAAMAAVLRAGDPGPEGDGGLRIGRLGRWQLVAEDAAVPPATLRPETWTGGARGADVWASVTPVVFDRHPKGEGEAYDQAVRDMVREACVRIGLREPVQVAPRHVSVHAGVPTSREFPRMERKDGSLRRHLHVLVRFPEPVRGPIAIGAGRFRGYGLLRPVADWGGR